MKNTRGICQENKVRFFEFDSAHFKDLPRKIVEGVVSVGLDAFGSGMTQEEILDHVYPTDRLYIAYDWTQVLAFGTAIVKEDTVDLAGAAVRNDARERGVYSELCLRRINFGIDRRLGWYNFKNTKSKNRIRSQALS